MTAQDRSSILEGYYKSHWPIECGGNRRQKATEGSLNAREKKAVVQSIRNERWNVMTIYRDNNEIFLGGTMPSFTGPEPFGWLQKIEPESLEILGETPKLPCGDHVWCGAIAAHQNGQLPEGSMGRIASDKTEDGEFIFIPGIEKIWKIKVLPNDLEVTSEWSPNYRKSNDDQGLSWDGCISDGSLWLMNNGDIDSLRAIYSTHPNGRFKTAPKELSWRRPAPWSCKQRLYRFDLMSEQFEYIEPFEHHGGGIIAPPVNIPECNICVCWDSINGGIAGIDTSNNSLKISWKIDSLRPTMQPVVFPESKELVINSFENNDDHLVVIDLSSGEILSKVALNSPLANGMFLTPGLKNDIFYCSTRTFARVSWK